VLKRARAQRALVQYEAKFIDREIENELGHSLAAANNNILANLFVGAA
jgi:hypothetical protein